MWEFSIQMDTQKTELAKFLFNSLDKIVKDFNGILTSFEENQKISIVVASAEIEKNRLEYHICDVLSKGISIYLKQDFLDKSLKMPKKSPLEIYTFKKALVSFDRETDRFLINKYLNLDKNLVIESFFYFKLRPLREKWEELIKIANENSTYLLSDDSFLELLRFLVENIEISSDEITVEIENNSISIFDSFSNNLFSEKNLDEFSIVDAIIDNSPKKVNWKSDVKFPFLEKVFEKRLFYVPSKNLQRNWNENWTLQN